MANRDVSFSLHLASSDDEQQSSPHSPPQYRAGALPKLGIPSPFQSEESSLDLESDIDYETPSTPGTPSTPLSPLGSEFSYLGVSSQTSEAGEFATPRPRKKRFSKRREHNWKRGPLFGRTSDASPSGSRSASPSASPSVSSKRPKICRPQSELFGEISFPPADKVYTVKTSEGGKMQEQELLVPRGNQIFNLEILSNVFSLLVCPDKSCNGRPRLHQHTSLDGLQRFFLLKCYYCHQIIAEFPASLPIGVSPDQCINDKRALRFGHSEINARALMAVHSTSSSWEDFRLTCSILDLHVPSERMSRKSLNLFVSASKAVVERSMNISGQKVFSISEPSTMVVPGTRECIVSFDASWHRRGHFSNQGFAAAIDSSSGKVLDYALYDRVCSLCAKWDEVRKVSNPDDYAEFWEKHRTACTSNYKGSSQAMETSAALEIWQRSIAKHQLVYGTYIGDGDSSSFRNLIKSDPYNGEVLVRKEECLGHAQKRVKKHLLKKSPLCKGLPDGKAKRIAHLYALVVVQNRGKEAADIRDALNVLLEHTRERHSNCPVSESSWCYYQKQIARRVKDDSLPAPTVRSPYLAPDEHQRAREVFDLFASLEFCGSITLGKTQNSNESLHSMIWHHAPKAKRVGQKSLIASTAMAVLSYNDGSLAYAAILKELGMDVSHNTLVFLSRRDKLRNMKRKRRIVETLKRRRRQMESQITSAESSRKRRNKRAVYESEKFGSELPNSDEDSESECTACHQRNCPLPPRRKKEEWVACHTCDCWYHWSCAGIKSRKKLPEYYFCCNCENI